MNREENEALWAAIREEYRSSELSLKKLSEKYGVSRSTLQRRCAREGWAAQREQYRAEGSLTGDTAWLLEETAKKILKQLQADFEDQQQFHRYLVKPRGTEEPEEQIFEKLDTKSLKEVTAALKDLKALLRQTEEEPEGSLRVVFEAGEEEWNE